MVARTAKARGKAYEKQGGRCFWCGVPTRRLARDRGNHLQYSTAEHLIPKSRGGTNAQRNIVSACKSCNHERGNMPIAMWLIVLMGRLQHSGRFHHFLEVLSSLRERGIHAVTQVGHPDNGPDTQTAKVPPPTDERPAP